MLYFMKDAKFHNSSILKLSKKDGHVFKQHLLPALKKIISNEAQNETFNTLEDLMQLLLIYEEIKAAANK